MYRSQLCKEKGDAFSLLLCLQGVDGCVGGLECQLGAVRGQERTLTVASKESLWTTSLPDNPLEVNMTSPLTSSIVQVC